MGLLSRLVVKCVRSTTSLAVTMDLSLGQVILVLVVSCLVGGGSSETLQVSSTGAAATKQGDKMGDYMLTSRTQNGHPVYKKTSGVRNFLYVSSNGFWTIGRTEGSTTSGIYNPQFATPSSKPPTSGWLYSDLPNGWRADDTLKVERKTASPAGVAAVDQSVLLRRQLLERQALERQLLAQTAPRTLPSTAAVVPATRAAQTTAAPTTAPAAGCPLRIQVLITSNSSLPTNTDNGQPANRYAGTGNNGLMSVPTQDYRGTYTRNDFLSAEGYPTYTNIANAAMTISRVTTVTGTQWQMSGGRSGATANIIQGITKPTGAAAAAVCSTANPPARANAVTATTTRAAVPQQLLCNLYGPHLVVNSNAACPPPSGWSFKVGPTEGPTTPRATPYPAGQFKQAKTSVRVTALP